MDIRKKQFHFTNQGALGLLVLGGLLIAAFVVVGNVQKSQDIRREAAGRAGGVAELSLNIDKDAGELVLARQEVGNIILELTSPGGAEGIDAFVSYNLDGKVASIEKVELLVPGACDEILSWVQSDEGCLLNDDMVAEANETGVLAMHVLPETGKIEAGRKDIARIHLKGVNPGSVEFGLLYTSGDTADTNVVGDSGVDILSSREPKKAMVRVE